MFDMVFNHTSDRNIWLRKALSGDPKYKDFYIFKKVQSQEYRLQTGKVNSEETHGNMWKSLMSIICTFSMFHSRI